MVWKFLRKILQVLVGTYYSLPIQSVVSQIKRHPSILFLWLLFTLAVNEQFMQGYGVPYLFLEPEYLGSVSGWSMFIMGICLGVFTLAYQMTCYILDGYQFFFLAIERQAFLKFSYNNSLIPTAFWIFYLNRVYNFQIANPLYEAEQVYINLGSLALGGFVMTTLSIVYFSLTYVDVVKYLGEKITRELRNPKVMIRKARKVMNTDVRVDYFFNGFFSVKETDPNIEADFKSILRSLNQNHRNAFITMIGILGIMVLLGIFQEVPAFVIPAGGSFFILFAFFAMIIGAFTFWFRVIGLLTIVGVAATLFFIEKYEPFVGRYYAFGMNYQPAPVPYHIDSLKLTINEGQYQQDYAATIEILQTWQQQYYSKYGYARKPKIVLLCVTGGGNRSAAWVARCLQYADSLTDRKFFHHVRLITGASGGMMGASYFRELLLERHYNPDTNLYTPEVVHRASSDLLNRITFHLIANLFIPSNQFQFGRNIYFKERGYAWEEQFIANTQAFYNKRLSDYREPERQCLIPMIIHTPAIVNDSRKLYISPQGVSYMCKPMTFNAAYSNEMEGIEFRRVFARHDPDSIRMATIVRMNASFPVVLPFIELPTQPIVQVIDAGAVDNYGMHSAVKFLYVFRDWIRQNTSGVVLVQIRDSQQEGKILETEDSFFDKLLGGISGTYSTSFESKDYINDEIMEYAKTWFGGSFDVIELQYIPKEQYQGATLNFHITDRERIDIMRAIHHPKNQLSFQTLKKLLE